MQGRTIDIRVGGYHGLTKEYGGDRVGKGVLIKDEGSRRRSASGASQGRVVFGASTLVKPRLCCVDNKVLSFFQDGVKFIGKGDSFKVNY